MDKAEEIVDIISNLNDDFKSYIIIAFTFLVLICFISYMMYLKNLNHTEPKHMNNLYSTLDGHITSITQDFSYNLCDYYIKTAYNACSGGSYKNDWVNLDNVKAIIKQGVRCLDFEIYSIDNEPVVATSTQKNYYIKETYNSVPFSEVMSTIYNYAFSSGTCPNYLDPLIIHLRIKSSNQEMYTNLANIFALYDDIMLGSKYSYENHNKNLGTLPLYSFRNKIILIVDNMNNSYLDNEDFLEYVNLTSNSVFMRSYNYTNIKNNPDVKELTNYNSNSMTIVLPDNDNNPSNPSVLLCRAYGCQMVAMRYQFVDKFLEMNAVLFDDCGYAFDLKPEQLRQKIVTIPNPIPQNPKLSYETRTLSTDYYSFNF